jgi:hypothetical protein
MGVKTELYLMGLVMNKSKLYLGKGGKWRNN